MSRYRNTQLNVSEKQKAKIKAALNSGQPVSIRFRYEDLSGNDLLALTQSQINKITKAYNNKRGVTLKLSLAQIKYNLKVEGGFLGMLAGLAARALPFLMKNVVPSLAKGALSGLASTGVSKILGNGLYLKKGGNVCQIETDGEGLYLKPYKGTGLNAYGNGLYLKQGGQVVDGRGLILGENSPFKNIPVLGWIL